MPWTITAGQSDEAWFEDYVETILSTETPLLPPTKQKIGATVVTWFETEPGIAHIDMQGGSHADKSLAYLVAREQLAGHSYRLAQYSYDWPRALRKEADWDEIQSKAVRLIQSGAVQIVKNGYNTVIAHVKGDNIDKYNGGKPYEVRIDRDEPNTRVVTTWDCQCPWDQFAWQRTRQWKKYEGRMCAHALATIWQSSKLPLDEDAHPANQQTLFDQSPVYPPSGPGPAQTPAAPAQGQQLAIPGFAPGTAQGTPPVAPGGMMPPQPGDPGIMPQFPMDPSLQPVINPVSVPGGKPQSPLNPMQWPGGTFSKVAAPVWQLNAPTEYGPHDVQGYKFVYDTRDGRGKIAPHTKADPQMHIMLNYDMGNHLSEQGHEGVVANDGLVNVYTHPGGDKYPPRLLQWIQQTVPHARYPQNAEELAEAQENSVRLAAGEFANGAMVQLNEEEMGIAEGKSEAHGSGSYRLIKKNSIGEVMGQDPTTGLVDVIFPLHDTGPMEPYHVRQWFFPSQLTPRPDVKRPGPFITRR